MKRNAAATPPAGRSRACARGEIGGQRVGQNASRALSQTDLEIVRAAPAWLKSPQIGDKMDAWLRTGSDPTPRWPLSCGR